ncbi:sigma-54-dependent Fis family transcriptional regulator [Methylocella tundrae]|uniref:sigma-54-dependent Fis family transcriptional regulator n=1 Tax=Methylocella tundrae TaxID=227605 RepID=UPI001FCF27EC|nr:sigma 54-interacting transcriptional regulator [Methylocella tundrae]
MSTARRSREISFPASFFGYVPGSFTGARTGGKTGKFVEAHTGVLFLDEIGDMALDLQTALLCALDSSEIVPVGGSRPVTVDVQVIAATNSDLPDCVRKGAFRRDLYYRLNGAQFWLPPLRERPDKLGLIEHLWEQEVKAQYVDEHKALSAEVWDIFERHPWPGNIRELRNVLRSCLAMTSGPETLVSDLPNDFLREMSDSALKPRRRVKQGCRHTPNGDPRLRARRSPIGRRMLSARRLPRRQETFPNQRDNSG